MAGFGLIHLGFLAATAAVAVPVLIHLLLRPRARRVEIGSLRFLQRVLKESNRRQKLRRWLLLALRTLVVLLLALLFARPFLPGFGVDGSDRVVILLIDQSASMHAVESGRTLFAAAQQAAEKVRKGLPEQTVVHLAYFDGAGVEPAADAHIDPLRQAGFAGTDYRRAIRWARDQLMLSPRRRHEVFLFSDLQRTPLRSVDGEELPDLPVTVVDIGKPMLKNLAVVRAEVGQLLIRPGTPAVVTAGVRNAGPFAVKGVRIRLSLQGADRIEQTQTVAVAALSNQEVRFSVPIKKAGLYTGFVEVAGDDALALDDRRWLGFEARPADQVLLVDGEPGRTVFGHETYYLEAALRLRPPNKGPSLTPYEPTRLAWENGAALQDMNRFRLVVLCNVSNFAADDLRQLREYVSSGGSLLLFTGGLVRPAGYEPLRKAGLLPAAIKGTAGPDLFGFSTWEKEHPIFRPLSDPQQGDLRRLAFDHLTLLEPAPNARVLAAAVGGEPLIVEGALNKGRVVLAAFPADRDWGPWPQGRLFVPLVHQLVGYLTERLPENQRVRHAGTGSGPANAPGVVVSGRTAVVRNLDPAESEIERFSVKQFSERFHLAEPGGGKATAASALPPGSQRPDELWIYVLWALLLLLLVEVFVANRTHA